MRYSPSEKLEIIRIVEDSDLSVRQTLKELGIHAVPFTTGIADIWKMEWRAWALNSPRPDPSGTRFLRK